MAKTKMDKLVALHLERVAYAPGSADPQIGAQRTRRAIVEAMEAAYVLGQREAASEES